MASCPSRSRILRVMYKIFLQARSLEAIACLIKSNQTKSSIQSEFFESIAQMSVQSPSLLFHVLFLARRCFTAMLLLLRKAYCGLSWHYKTHGTCIHHTLASACSQRPPHRSNPQKQVPSALRCSKPTNTTINFSYPPKPYKLQQVQLASLTPHF